MTRNAVYVTFNIPGRRGFDTTRLFNYKFSDISFIGSS